MSNIVVLTGHITKDLELRKTKNNNSFCAFSIGNNVGYGDHKKVNFININCYGAQADFITKYAHKGDKVHIEGTLNVDAVKGVNGTTYYTYVLCNQVELLTSKKKEEGDTIYTKDVNAADSFVVDSDELPFM